MILETLVYSREKRLFLKLCFTRENRDGSWNFGLLARTEMVLETLIYSRE